jgi:thiol-disulfide isomerase/thioredoxin
MAGLLANLPQFKQGWKFLLVFGAIIALIFAIVYVWKNYVSPKLNPSYVSNKEFIQDGDNSSEADIRIFVVDWCPHCKKAEPIWDEVSDEYNGKVISGYKLNFIKVDCTNDDDPDVKNTLNQFNIEGYPTIKLLKDNQVIEYDASPNKETLIQFINTVLSK